MPSFIDIEIYDQYGEGFWTQEKYLVHGHDDVLWTSNIDDAMSFIKESVLALSVDLTKGGSMETGNLS